MKWLEKIEENFIGIIMLVVSVVLFANVVLRYVFNASSTWAEEFIRYAIIWMTFIGAGICFRKGLHPGIDVIFNIFPKSMKRGIKIFVIIISIIFMSFMLKYGYDLLMFSITTGQITPALQVKLYWVYAAIPVGALLSLIHLVRLFITTIKDKKQAEI